MPIADAIAAVAKLFGIIIPIMDRREQEAKAQHDKLAEHSVDELHVGADELRPKPPAV